MKYAAALAALLTSAPLCAQAEYLPFGRDPADPVSSFAIRDKAGNEQHHLVRPAPSPGRVEAERCLPKTHLCFSLNEQDNQGRPLLRIRTFGGGVDQSLPLDLHTRAGAEYSIWTLAVRRVPHEQSDAKGEGILIGVESQERVAYSGGNAQKKVLWLYRIDHAGTSDAVAQQVLSVPLQAEQTIRACFNAKDERARHNACLDRTSVEAMLVLDADNADAMPRFIYRVATGSYPSDIPFRDPEQMPKKLTRQDLVSARHPVCSYDRNIIWNPATVRFEFDRPAPDCRIFGLER